MQIVIFSFWSGSRDADSYRMSIGSKGGEVYKKNAMVGCSKTITFWVKHLKLVATCCLNWDFFHSALYCCVRYRNTKFQDEIQNLSLEAWFKWYWLNLVLGIDFMTLNILKLDSFSSYSLFHYKLEGTHYKNVKKNINSI